MRTIELETVLPTRTERVWQAMQSPATFLYVCKGPVRRASVGRPVRAAARRRTWHGLLFAFHFIPAYRHTIEIAEVDETSHMIRSRGILTAWNHTLRVEPIDEYSCRYSDKVEIAAGRATRIVAVIATGIFRYRKRRWRKLVRKHLLPGGPAYAR